MSTVITFEQGTGFSPRIVRVLTTSTFAQVTTAGWWNNSPIAGEQLQSQDQVQICYSYGTSLQATAIFDVSIGANNVVTLSIAESNVILPVVSGHFANFSGTGGAIKDDGYLPTNASLTKVVMQSGAAVIGNIPKYADTSGTLVDSGVSAALYQPLTAIVTLTAANVIAMYATPQLIVAAPASGFALMPIAAQIITVVSTAFTSGGVAQLQWGSTVHAGGTVALDNTTPTAEITAAASQIYTQYGIATTTATPIATANGLGLYFTNATQAFATGTGSTVTVAVTYMTVPV